MTGFMELPPSRVYVSDKCLTRADREEISRRLRNGKSYRSIARRLERAASTVSRDVNRNGSGNGKWAWHGTEAAMRRTNRPEPKKIFL